MTVCLFVWIFIICVNIFMHGPFRSSLHLRPLDTYLHFAPRPNKSERLTFSKVIIIPWDLFALALLLVCFHELVIWCLTVRVTVAGRTEGGRQWYACPRVCVCVYVCNKSNECPRLHASCHHKSCHVDIVDNVIVVVFVVSPNMLSFCWY